MRPETTRASQRQGNGGKQKYIKSGSGGRLAEGEKNVMREVRRESAMTNW